MSTILLPLLLQHSELFGRYCLTKAHIDKEMIISEAYPEISGQMEGNQFAVCESSKLYLPIDMYGVLQYKAHQIFLSSAHEGLLVHYIWHDF